MRAPGTPRRRARSRRGVTLPEILIAATLLAIVFSAMVALLLSESRFVSRVGGDIAALDQAGVAEEMLRAEVASLPAGALLVARPDSLAFRLPLSWGVVCGPLDRNKLASGAKKKKKTPVVYSTTAALALEPAAAALGNPTPDGIALSADGETFAYHAVNPWSTLGLAQSAAAGEACVNRTPVASGVTLYRATAAGAQPVAGPFAAQAGFRYRLASGETATFYAGAGLSGIRAIRATLPALREQWGAVEPDTVYLDPWLYLVNVR